MYYIFDINNDCVATCNFFPNVDDLSSRGETYIEDEREFPSLNLLKNDNGSIKVCEPEEEEKPTYEDILKKIREEVNEYRENIENKDIEYKNKFYQADAVSLNRLFISLSLDNNEIEWKTSDNSIEILTKEDINNIIKLIAERNSNVFSCVSDIKDKINSIDRNKISNAITEEEAITMLKELKNTMYL